MLLLATLKFVKDSYKDLSRVASRKLAINKFLVIFKEYL